MPGINDITFNENIDELINDLNMVQPNSNDMLPASNKKKPGNKNNATKKVKTEEEQTASTVQIAILKCLKEIKDNISDLHVSLNDAKQEISSLKGEVGEYKNLVQCQEQKIDSLQNDNNNLQRKINGLERDSRINKVILSGPLIKINNNLSPVELLDQSVKHIKNVYNHDIARIDVSDCYRLRGKEDAGINNNQRIILSFNNTMAKNSLMSSVIKTNKTRGVNLNINEYLSAQNAHILYVLRCLRKKHHDKIFACFSRNGLVYYKAQKESRPKLIIREEDISALSKEIEEYGMIRQGQYNEQNLPHHNN
jgi:hypothetical protein